MNGSSNYNIKFMCIVWTTILSLFYLLPAPTFAEKLMSYSYLLLTGWAFVESKRIHKDPVNILSIYLFLLLYFNGMNIVWDILGILDMDDPDWFSGLSISSEDNARALFNMNLSIIAVVLGNSICPRAIDKSVTVEEIHIPDFVLYILLFVGMSVKAFFSIKGFYLTQTLGYHESFAEGGGFPWYANVLSLLALFVLLIKIKECKKVWYVLLLVYIALSMATGQRSKGLLVLFIFIYILYSYRIMELNATKVIALGVVFLLISIGVATARNGNEFISEISQVVEFVEGAPYKVLQKSVQFREYIDYNFIDMFGNIKSTFSDIKGEKLTARALEFKVWNGYISYICNSTMYLAGWGMGGNFIGQLFAVGREFAVIIGSIFVGYFLNVINSGLFSNNCIKRFFFFNLAFTFLYISRDHLFCFLTTMISPITAICIVLLFRPYFYYKK